MAIVDLSFPIRPHFRWRVAPERVATHAKGDPLQSTVVTISCHAYTHVDAPLHFLPDGSDVATMPIDQWIGDAAVVDLTHLGANGEVSAAELDKRGAHVRRGDIVLLRTDWPRKTSVESPRFWKEGPFTGASGCEWLVARGVKAVGYDYPPDQPVRDLVLGRRRPIAPEEWATHHSFFPAGIGVIEYLVNLDRLGRDRVRFLALPLKLDGGDGAPARAIAILD